jgi:hypothetical protein
MNVILDTLFLRKPRIEYVSPAICEAQFSSSGGPVIILPDILRQHGPTGGRAGGRGRRFFSFDNYPGQLCFQIYEAVDPTNPDSPYNLISECIPNGAIALCSEGYYEISAINGQGHESARSSPIFVPGDGYTVVTLPVFPQTVAYNLYKSTGDQSGPFHLYWYGFSGNSFEVCTPGCYRITVITGDGETPLSDPTCTDFTCTELTCPDGLGWNTLLCECVPCDLTENPCPPGYIWRPADCACILSGGGGGDLTDILGPDETLCVGTPYTSDISAVGGTAPYVWSLVNGSIPAGLTLDLASDTASMTLDGTPTTAQDYNFRIRVDDIVGDFMEKDFSLTVKASCCGASTDWINSPGTCRLRIKNYVDGIFPDCTSCAFTMQADSGPLWDGEFSAFGGSGTYTQNVAQTQLQGILLVSARILKHPVLTQWSLQFTVGTFGGGNTVLWRGRILTASPIGLYATDGGCTDGCIGHTNPPTIEIESFSP